MSNHITSWSGIPKKNELMRQGNNNSKASFVSTGSIPIGMDKYNKKIMIVTIRDPDLFRVEN
jgi:hypothetical protein